MKVLIAIDSFKSSLSTLEAGTAVAKGIKLADHKNKTEVAVLADGGEGTVEVLTAANHGELVTLKVHGPLNKKVDAQYGFVASKKLAIVEMSKASGLPLLKPEEKNPLYTTTYGVGELIKDAIGRGCRDFIIAIGGSATNDGGVGMLMALGYRFLNANNKPISKGAIGLKDLVKIDISKRLKELDECHFLVASDVSNPLCGERGCSAVFGPQKGATPEMIRDMDYWLHNYGQLTEQIFKKKLINKKGAGAAGGLGFALISYFKAKLEPGIDIVLRQTKLESRIKKADVVVTGEGRLDGQTIMGKAPIGVAKIAKKYNKPVIGFAAILREDVNIINKYGIDAYFCSLNKLVTKAESKNKANASDNLTRVSEQVFRLIKEFKK